MVKTQKNLNGQSAIFFKCLKNIFFLIIKMKKKNVNSKNPKNLNGQNKTKFKWSKHKKT